MPTGMRTVSQKMGVKPGARAYLKNAPDEAVESLCLPELERPKRLTGAFDYLHLFVKKQAQFTRAFLQLKRHLAPAEVCGCRGPKAGSSAPTSTSGASSSSATTAGSSRA